MNDFKASPGEQSSKKTLRVDPRALVDCRAPSRMVEVAEREDERVYFKKTRTNERKSLESS